MSGIFLGINSAYHEPAACLIVDDHIVAMAEEERFNRFRHGKLALIDNSDVLPLKSAEFCLNQAGLSWKDVTAIGYSLDPDARLAANAHRQPEAMAKAGSWGTEDGERTFFEHNMAAKDKLVQLAPQAEFRFFPHHLCHAASAHLVSPFENSAVLVADGIGEFDSTWLGLGKGSNLSHLQSVPFPNSLGFVWEKMSEFLGFDAYSGPGKVMGYAAISDPEGEFTGKDYLGKMHEIFRPGKDGTFFVDGDAFRFATDDFSGLERLFGPRRKVMVDRYEDASIASALQTTTSDVLVNLANWLYEQVNSGADKPIEDLSISGGVALNCVANYEIAARTPFKRIWIQPAANDAGTAMGAAALLSIEHGGKRPTMHHAYLGPGFSDDQYKAALDSAGLSYTTDDDIPGTVAQKIEHGDIFAWFQGRQEVGPRALGNRSIVCDPTRFDTRMRINAKVKHRESFRPFAPSVLPEALGRFFQSPSEMLSTRYMLFALPLKEPRQKQIIPAVIQENGSTGIATSRIHLVDKEYNPRYYALIDEFRKLLDIPLVLNTSFNIREPIVTIPEQAIATFARSSMDGMVMGPYLVKRPSN